MKIGTKELIFRLTAAAISFALTGVFFRVAVAHSQGAPIVAQDTASGSYETPVANEAAGLGGRQRVNHYLFNGSRDRLR